MLESAQGDRSCKIKTFVGRVWKIEEFVISVGTSWVEVVDEEFAVWEIVFECVLVLWWMMNIID